MGSKCFRRGTVHTEYGSTGTLVHGSAVADAVADAVAGVPCNMSAPSEPGFDLTTQNAGLVAHCRPKVVAGLRGCFAGLEL
jgi:hypothetical protein